MIPNQTMVNNSFQITNVNNSLTLSYINSGLSASTVNGGLPLNNLRSGLPVSNINSGLSLSNINNGLPLSNVNSGLLLGNVSSSSCNSPCKIKEDPGIDSVTQLLIPVRDPLSNEIKNTLVPMEMVDVSGQYTAKNILTPIAGNDGNLTYDVKKVGLPVHLDANPLARLENTVVWNNSATTQIGDKHVVSYTCAQKQVHEKKKEDTQLFIILTGSQMKQLANIQQTGNDATEIGNAAQVATTEGRVVPLEELAWDKSQGMQIENKPKVDTEEKGTETTELEMEEEKETEIQWANPPPQYVRSVCPVCQKVFKTRRLMGRHLRSIHKKTLSCDKCNKRYSTRQSLLTHQRSHEDDYYLECPICHLRYKREAGLKNHQIRVHSNVEPKYMCDYCGKRYKLKFDLSKHIERIHPSSSHICKSCGKIVKDIGHHEWVHERAAKKAITLRYRCHLCSKRFSTRNNLDNHLLLHKDGFKCNLCGETCKSQTSLSYHKERKHKPTARCSICEKSFSRTSFYQHVLTHAGIRPYKCDVCGEDFTQRSSVLRHRKTHPGPLPPYTESTPIANIAKQILEKLS
ncbi:unnamed protein product [Xylocopa violacea]|uniref:C2H2-type domain-containing protein n=1 Tax=Xylocopa violacea TaxID=135666 RepID=A0ABP1MZ74_XYLVO